MKLLVITQVVDKTHPILGFFHRWLIEFSKSVDELHVIALFVGEHDLPSNVHVHSLGKEDGVGRLIYLWRFYKYIFSLKYDNVFVHMNQVYVLLGWKWWKLTGKKIGLWYVHREVSLSLRLASTVVDTIFTTGPESFRLESKKVEHMGHGIAPVSVESSLYEDGQLSLISIGRVSPVKRIELIGGVAKKLDAKCVVVGGPGTKEDEVYFADMVEEFGEVSFTGPLSHEKALSYLADAHFFVHVSKTGSTDKVVLEALLAGVPVISTGEAFKDMLSPYGLWSEGDSIEEVVSVLCTYLTKSIEERRKDITALQAEVREKHALASLITRICEKY